SGLAAALDLRNVTFLGVHERVPSFIGAADLLALTSDTEGVPAVILEAGYLGVPVIATDAGGVSEVVIHGKTGYVVEKSDTSRFAGLMRDLIRFPQRRNELGVNARLWVEQ